MLYEGYDDAVPGSNEAPDSVKTPAHFDLPLFRKLLIERNTHYCLHKQFVAKIFEVL